MIRKHIKIISSVVFLAVTISLVWWFFFAAPNLVSKSEDFLEAIKTKNFAEAFEDYLSSSFQESKKIQDLEAFFKNFEDVSDSSEWIPLPEFHAEDALLLRGRIKLKNGDESSIQFTYIQEEWIWKIYAIQMGGVSLGDKKDISWETVKDIIDVANEKKDIVDIISKAWKKQIENDDGKGFHMHLSGMDKLKNISFSNVRGNVIDPVSNVDGAGDSNNLTDHIDEVDKGVINLKTLFTTDTALGYLDIDYIREFLSWKPMRLNVQIRCYVEGCLNVNERKRNPRSIVVAVDNARGLSPKEQQLNEGKSEEDIKAKEVRRIKTALESFIKKAVTDNDNVALLIYDEEIKFSGFKNINQLDEIVRYLENITYSGERTFTREAITRAVDNLKNEGAEKILLIIDDGSDSRSNVRESLAEDATDKLRSENITTYGIGVTGINVSENRNPGEFNRVNELIDLIFSISHNTNGDYYFVIDGDGVVKALEKLSPSFTMTPSKKNLFDLIFDHEQEFQIDPLFSSITPTGQSQFTAPKSWWLTWLPGLIIGIAIIIAALIVKPQVITPEVISIIPAERMCIELASIGRGNYDFEETFKGVKSIIIGSDENSDIVLEGEDINNKHARISYENGHYMLSDISARKNVFYNDIQVVAPCQLNDRDEIMIGANRYRVRISEIPSTAERQAATRITNPEELAPTKVL